MSLSPFNQLCPVNNYTTPWTFETQQPVIMPLVTPKATGDKTEEWTNKLVGKNIHDEQVESSTTVCIPGQYNSQTLTRSVLCQARAARAVEGDQAGDDGHQGLQGGQTQRARRRLGDCVARHLRLDDELCTKRETNENTNHSR